jgi:thymidylate synthase ThyX
MTFLSEAPSVTLVQAFRRPFDGAVAAARTCYSAGGIVSPEEVAGDGLGIEVQEKRRARRDLLAQDLYEAGHHTTYQHAHFQFALRNVSRQFVWTFLHSHPWYNSEQTSQRYVEVKSGSLAIPPLSQAALDLFLQAAGMQMAAYRELTRLIQPVAAEAFFGTFRGRRSQPERWAGAIGKRAMEVARYVLPIATHTTLYHTISAITLFRYRRLASSMDAPSEQRLVVDEMVRAVLDHDPGYAAVLEDPIPLEETPEFEALQRLSPSFQADSSVSRRFRAEFDASLGGFVSRLVDRKGRSEELLASSVREVLGVPADLLCDDDAIALALDPAANPLLGEALNLTSHAKLTRALSHPSYTFRKKLSHAADSQDQRHRMTPASRPLLHAYLTDEPDVITPKLLLGSAAAEKLYLETVEKTWDAVRGLRSLGVPDEFRAYLLPNAVALRFTESADLSALRHKLAMRLCFNAQEEIWQASLDEALQIREVEPRIGSHLLPPCGHRLRAGKKPICPEGPRFCGVPVWKLDPSDYDRKF